MNSQTVLNSIATYRLANNGNVPAAVIVDGNSVECIDYNTLVDRSEIVDPFRVCDEYRVFVVNYDIQDYYANNFPVLVDKYIKTTIKDYLFFLLEKETRP